MSKYIDADLFKEYADKPSIYDTTDLKDMINEQPTADVQPIINGKIINIYDDFKGRKTSLCASCRNRISSHDNYCKYCGARMGGEK